MRKFAVNYTICNISIFPRIYVDITIDSIEKNLFTPSYWFDCKVFEQTISNICQSNTTISTFLFLTGLPDRVRQLKHVNLDILRRYVQTKRRVNSLALERLCEFIKKSIDLPQMLVLYVIQIFQYQRDLESRQIFVKCAKTNRTLCSLLFSMYAEYDTTPTPDIVLYGLGEDSKFAIFTKEDIMECLLTWTRPDNRFKNEIVEIFLKVGFDHVDMGNLIYLANMSLRTFIAEYANLSEVPDKLISLLPWQRLPHNTRTEPLQLLCLLKFHPEFPLAEEARCLLFSNFIEKLENSSPQSPLIPLLRRELTKTVKRSIDDVADDDPLNFEDLYNDSCSEGFVSEED